MQKCKTGRTGKSHILLHPRGEGSGNRMLLCWVVWFVEPVSFIISSEFLRFISAPTLEPCFFFTHPSLMGHVVTSAELTLWP